MLTPTNSQRKYAARIVTRGVVRNITTRLRETDIFELIDAKADVEKARAALDEKARLVAARLGFAS